MGSFEFERVSKFRPRHLTMMMEKGGEGYKEGGRRRTEKDALEREREGLVLHSYPGQISW